MCTSPLVLNFILGHFTIWQEPLSTIKHSAVKTQQSESRDVSSGVYVVLQSEYRKAIGTDRRTGGWEDEWMDR